MVKLMIPDTFSRSLLSRLKFFEAIHLAPPARFRYSTKRSRPSPYRPNEIGRPTLRRGNREFKDLPALTVAKTANAPLRDPVKDDRR